MPARRSTDVGAGVRREPERKALELGVEVWANPSISLLDQLKVEAQILFPVMQALRSELGDERAEELVTEALREWRRKVIARHGASFQGSTREKFAMLAAAAERMEIDFAVSRADEAALDFDVTGCRYADLFHALDEPVLGTTLVCECDDHIVDVIGPDLELERTQTIMKGGDCCDFRFRLDEKR